MVKWSGKIKVGVLLRNGWACLGFGAGDDVAGGVAGDPVAQEVGAAAGELCDFQFVGLEVGGELVGISLDEFDGDVLDVCLSDVSQAITLVGTRVCPYVI